jgi:cytidine deaminase
MSVQSRAVESFPVASSAALSPYSKFKMGSEVKGGSKTISKSVEKISRFL